MIKIDIAGKRFSQLIALKRTSGNSNKFLYWECLCDCGKKTVVRVNDLRTGNTKSCGCRRGSPTHLMSKTKVYKAWKSMRPRCYNPAHKFYDKYGGRGITVCAEWKNNFNEFFKDMGHPPSKAHSIERINNDGNYEPSNCRWATRKEQQGNKSNSKNWNIRGKIFDSSKEAAIHFNVDATTIERWCRGHKQGKYYYPPKSGCYSEAKYADYIK